MYNPNDAEGDRELFSPDHDSLASLFSSSPMAPQHPATHPGVERIISAGDLVSRAEGYPRPTGRMARLLSNLEKNPAKDIETREGRQLQWDRPLNVEAILLTATGTQAAAPCGSCVAGYGPFTACVVVDGEVGGCCGNCHYNCMGRRCSFLPRGEPAGSSRKGGECGYGVGAVGWVCCADGDFASCAPRRG
ncbi:DUF3716 domain-containing protein [Candidatus Bathyarchaeota archaeon]|nr:DUF3716 domain-containing protein [Candidatus Bathyarchaeota archaeon]